jgi:peptidoglycan hydrolase CwlO-like protein
MAAQSILEERRVVEQEKYDELNLLLCDNEEKVRRLEERIEELNLEVRNLVYQLEKKAGEHEKFQKKQEKGLFEDFTQFHREEMTKIIE